MKLYKLLATTSVALALLVSASTAVEVNENEIRSTSNEVIQFENYTGPHIIIESAAAITEIGSNLGRQVASNLNTSRAFGLNAKYTIIHALDPNETGKLDADILLLNSNAGVDHIRNLRRIITGYLMAAYGYNQRDASTLATFITVYNAVYRGRLDVFESKYKTVVTQNLTAESCGLSTRWSSWPGNTQIVIPLFDINGGLSTVDTSVISDDNVIDSMREKDDKGMDERRNMVDIQTREADNFADKAQEKSDQAEQAQSEADKAKQDADQAQSEADKAKQDADQAQSEADKAKQDADQAQSEADKAKQDADQAQKDATQAQKEANQAQKDADKAQKDADKAQKDAEANPDDKAKAEAAQKAQEEADKAQAEADKAQSDADKAKEDANKAKEDAKQAQSEADKAKEDAKQAQSEADKAKSDSDQAQNEADAAKANADQAQSDADKAKEEADQAQELADKKNEDAQHGRMEIAKDQQKILQDALDSETSKNAIVALTVIDSEKDLSGLVKVDPKTGSVIKESPVTVVRGRKLYPVTVSDSQTEEAGEASQGETMYVAICGDATGTNSAIKLCLLDSTDLEIQKESTEIVAEKSMLVQDGDNFYCIVQSGSNWVLAKYDSSLNLLLKGSVPLMPNTPITVAQRGIVVSNSDGKIILLSTKDFSQVQ